MVDKKMRDHAYYFNVIITISIFVGYLRCDKMSSWKLGKIYLIKILRTKVFNILMCILMIEHIYCILMYYIMIVYWKVELLAKVILLINSIFVI